jgi:hypothetical protein
VLSGLGGVRVLAEALVALASTGGTAVVTAMATDSWEGLKARFARLLGRGDVKETEAVAARLEQSREKLAGASGRGMRRAQAEQEIAWRTRLEDLLENNPDSAKELEALVAEVQAQVIGSAGRVDQHAAAFDQARQAVLGHGVQNVTFGDQGGPGASAR